MAENTDIARHPDLIELRKRYEMASAAPVTEVAEGLVLLAAVFLAASPWIVGFSGLSAITVNNLIAGGALALLTVVLTSAYGRMHGIAWVIPAIGVWTIVAPWAIAGSMDTTRTIFSNAISGGAIVVFGLVMLGMGFLRARRPGR